ncbi:disease resistance protein SUMM2-like [Pistacia vera]|uniref:disease resistance protein SUMM2-like n=1 Tax=Pistacia vera TaxID=55513 RepID=UPI001263D5D9|nr:disease resistance protein SUMM2-like [Pistacia vera]
MTFFNHLDLSATIIEKLPIELKALVNLKWLDLDYSWDLHKIPHQLISHFLKMNVLRMLHCGYGYSPSGQAITEDTVLYSGGELLLEELLNLKYLNVWSICFRSSSALGKFLRSAKLQISTQFLCLHCFDDSKSLNVLALAYLNHLHTLNIHSCKYLEELKIENVQNSQPYYSQTLYTVGIYMIAPNSGT